MDVVTLSRAFEAIGARVKLVPQPSTRDLVLDVHKDRHGEFFEVRFQPGKTNSSVHVLDVQKANKHLLVMVRSPGFFQHGADQKEKYLCGHDERQWFVAAVPGNASTVRTAMEALQPVVVRVAQAMAHVKFKDRVQRRNAAVLRQGEWFFLPESILVVDPKLVLRNEPIRRGGNKPHMAEEAFRSGGTQVWVCSAYPNGVLDWQYRSLLQKNPVARNWRWESRVREPRLYVRGTIRHPDHKTLRLAHWHRVVPNTESQASARGLAFID